MFSGHKSHEEHISYYLVVSSAEIIFLIFQRFGCSRAQLRHISQSRFLEFRINDICLLSKSSSFSEDVYKAFAKNLSKQLLGSKYDTYLQLFLCFGCSIYCESYFHRIEHQNKRTIMNQIQ